MEKFKYLKEIKEFIGECVKYDEEGGGYIWGAVKDGIQMIAQVKDVVDVAYNFRTKESPIVSIRGWGAIQHLFKTSEEQIAFQNELGIFIQDAINEKLQNENKFILDADQMYDFMDFAANRIGLFKGEILKLYSETLKNDKTNIT